MKTPAEQLKSEIGKQATNCMLEQWVGTTVGVAAGVALSLKKKSKRPFVYGVSFGTAADMIYGYNGPCRPYVQAYLAANEEWAAKVNAKHAEDNQEQ